MTDQSLGASLLEGTSGQATLCVGIDPHASTLTDWGLADDSSGLATFSNALVQGVIVSGVRVVKPQVALFERCGLPGLQVLSDVIGTLREAGVAVIADVKRGDIGTSLQGYADAWLQPGSDFESDAMTLVGYQGLGALRPAFDLARDTGKTVFVLSATSNPEGTYIQRAVTASGNTVAGEVLSGLQALVGATPEYRGVLGAVVGATVDQVLLGVDCDAAPDVVLLVPGFGHQGVALETTGRLFGAATPRVVAAVSRSVAGDSPDGLEDRISLARQAVSRGAV